MSKILALYMNELIKISKKISILIMALIMLVGVIGLGGLMKFQERMQSQYQTTDVAGTDWMLEEMRFQQERLESDLELASRQLEDYESSEQDIRYHNLVEQIASLEDELALYERAIEDNIMLFRGESFLSRSLYGINNAKARVRGLERVPENERDERWQENYTLQEQLIEGYDQVIISRDFEAFIQLETQAVERNPDLTDEDRRREIDRLLLWQQLDPGGGLDPESNIYQINNLVSEVDNLRRSLEDYIDYTGQMGPPIPLTPERYDDLENQLAVLIYQIEHDLVSFDYGGSFAGMAIESMLSFGAFMIVLMILILAGGAISQEIATGSIKSLIISPAKRWKIFAAKVMSLVTVSFAALLVLYMVSILAHGILFGFSSGNPYIYAVSGRADSIGFHLFQLAALMVRWIDILVFLAFALMLSVMTRNTAAAVGVSMAAFFGNSIVQPFLMFLPRAEWIKFLPFDHIGLVDRFFPFRETTMSMGAGVFGMTSGPQPSLLFSIVYLTVLVFCLIYIGLDSFNRRDIK